MNKKIIIMKKFLFPVMFGLGFISNTNAQHTIYHDDFDSYANFSIATVGSWTLTDVDLKPTFGFTGITFANTGVAKSFQVFNSLATTPVMTPDNMSNWTAHSGNKNMVAFGATSAPWNDDWMITPKIQLASDGGTLTFWAKDCDSRYGAEKFRVYVSTTGTAVSNFTAIKELQITPSDATWHQYTYDLSSYANQEIHIAIRCTSDDQFGFAVDDFKVTSTTNRTTVPSCAALTLPANAATNVTAAGTNFVWASSSGAESYDFYLDTNPNPTTFIKNVVGTGYSHTSTLAANTTYYWKAVPKNANGSASDCPVFSFTTGALVPGCANMTTPANGATNVAYGPTALSWTAPSTGLAQTGYDLYFGTDPAALTIINSPTATALTYSVTTTIADTTYYWKVVPKNANGSAENCTTYSFTTRSNPVAPYCGPITYSTPEPITYVNMSYNTANTSSAVVAGAVSHEAFLTKEFKVERDNTTKISINSNTNGTSFKHYYTVFIDWNKDGDFNDAGESYFTTSDKYIGNLGSDGLSEAKIVSGDIAVPATVTLGKTRMRIKAVYSSTAAPSATGLANMVNPCANTGSAWGQAEDYTIDIVEKGELSVSDMSKAKIALYPNPFVDVVKISDVKNVKSITVNDITGRQVKTLAPATELNLSGLNAGVYIINLNMEDGTIKTFKSIKK